MWLVKKLGYFAMLLVIVVVARIVGGEMGRSAATEARQKSTPHAELGAFDQATLERNAKILNKDLPKTVAPGMDLSVTQSEPGRAFTYYFKYSELAAANIDMSAMKANIVKALQTNICTDESNSIMLKDGVSLRYVYQTSDSVEIARLAVNGSDCAFDTTRYSSTDGFSAYPVAPFKGSVRLPDFTSRDKAFATFRTRIRNGMQEGPNFAGSLSFIEIGCGTSCRFGFVGDVSSGKVYAFPLGGEDYYSMSLHYLANSRLVVAQWESLRENQCYQARYYWNGGSFDLLGKQIVGARDACN